MIDFWYVENLCCPVDGESLQERLGALACSAGHRYPVEDGVPIMLSADGDPTIADMVKSREAKGAPWYTESVFVNEEQRQQILEAAKSPFRIDPVAAFLVGATNGIGYKHLIGTLEKYPIPNIRLPDGRGRRLLDVGCSWGRWSIAATRAGYDVVGIDPSLGAVMAARRVAKQLGYAPRFVVGDARSLPFENGSFDNVFSYSVIQHFSEHDAVKTFQDIGRVLKPGGNSLIQMPTRWGIRCLYNQLRRGFAEPNGFEVRYWRLSELEDILTKNIGITRYTVDCYFGIGWQHSDLSIMPFYLRMVVKASEVLRRSSCHLPFMRRLADSVYASSCKA